MGQLDSMGFVEEINLFRHFDWNSKTFAFETIAFADWGCWYVELRFRYPVPVFPNYLFSRISKSCQITGPSPLKLDSIQQLSGDIWAQFMEAWTLMASVLQFWTDEETIKDSEIFGGWVHLASALVEYMMTTINPHLEPGCEVTWEEVVCRTPWIRRHLAGNSTKVRRIHRQPIPVEGQSSNLEIAMEEYYNQELRRLETPRQGVVKDKLDSSKTITGLGHGQSLKMHLKKVGPEKGWTHLDPKELGPDVGQK